MFFLFVVVGVAGIWRVTLDPVEAGGPYNVTAAAQDSTAALTDVLFGDVWLCGGQSNMWLQTSKVSRGVSRVTQEWEDKTFAVIVKKR